LTSYFGLFILNLFIEKIKHLEKCGFSKRFIASVFEMSIYQFEKAITKRNKKLRK